jgi:hypothetical protein
MFIAAQTGIQAEYNCARPRIGLSENAHLS